MAAFEALTLLTAHPIPAMFAFSSLEWIIIACRTFALFGTFGTFAQFAFGTFAQFAFARFAFGTFARQRFTCKFDTIDQFVFGKLETFVFDTLFERQSVKFSVVRIRQWFGFTSYQLPLEVGHPIPMVDLNPMPRKLFSGERQFLFRAVGQSIDDSIAYYFCFLGIIYDFAHFDSKFLYRRIRAMFACLLPIQVCHGTVQSKQPRPPRSPGRFNALNYSAPSGRDFKD